MVKEERRLNSFFNPSQVQELFWMQELSFVFDVIFDQNSTLKSGRHHVITPIEFYYYKDYVEDSTGKVTSKGMLYSRPLTTHEFVVKIPGKYVVTYHKEGLRRGGRFWEK
jgi:hypothetical protein